MSTLWMSLAHPSFRVHLSFRICGAPVPVAIILLKEGPKAQEEEDGNLHMPVRCTVITVYENVGAYCPPGKGGC